MMATVVREAASEKSAGTRRALVVIGMHRSGTSAMTRSLSLLGASLPARLIPASASNPSGHWEPQSVADLNDEILQAVDSEWDDVFAFRPREYLSNFDRFYIGRALEVLEQEFDACELIVLKDPRISVLTAFWDRALREAGYETHYVIMVRNPLEVAESLRERDKFPREKSLLLWSAYMLAADRDTRDKNRTFVSFDQLMSDWRSVASRIEKDTGVPFPRATAAAGVEIDRYLSRSMRHHNAAADEVLSRVDVPDEVKILYRIFSEACEGAAVDAAVLEGIRLELEKMELLVGPLLADIRASARALGRELAQVSDAHAAACDRAASLEGRLEAERTAREAETKAASDARADHERRFAELTERITSIEAERERLAGEAQAKTHQAAELANRVSAVEAERDRVAAEREIKTRDAADLAERVSAVEAERDIAAAERDQKVREAVELAERLSSVELERDKVAAEVLELNRRHAGECRRLEERVAALGRELRREQSAVAEVRRGLADKEAALQLAQEARDDALAAAKENGEKLADRYQELATLTNLLRHEEQRREQIQEQVSWLVALSQTLARQPRWWSLVPKPWRRQRAYKLLSDAGLFDGAAYLKRYPDVSAEGADPLEHFLNHGMKEGRTR